MGVSGFSAFCFLLFDFVFCEHVFFLFSCARCPEKAELNSARKECQIPDGQAEKRVFWLLVFLAHYTIIYHIPMLYAIRRRYTATIRHDGRWEIAIASYMGGREGRWLADGRGASRED